ncbi:MAG: WbqC family protein [Nitrospinae bacterium]|nr:WbqC family protein [Nitrospinota bacterium]
MTKTVIIQPSYLPWLGYFEMMYMCDVFVFYDDVQYTKSDWRNRNRIKGPEGVSWLTVPVKTKGRFPQPLNMVEINNDSNWRKKHLDTLQRFYASAPYFKEVFGAIKPVYEKEWYMLNHLNIELTRTIIDILGFEKKLLLSSKLNVPFFDNPAQRVVEVCKTVNTTHFYNGAAGRNLYSHRLFEENGIVLEFQDYHHPVYSQLWGEFQPYLSVIDLLFNHGEESLPIIRGKLLQ